MIKVAARVKERSISTPSRYERRQTFADRKTNQIANAPMRMDPAIPASSHNSRKSLCAWLA
jgi:hypothetical protein